MMGEFDLFSRSQKLAEDTFSISVPTICVTFIPLIALIKLLVEFEDGDLELFLSSIFLTSHHVSMSSGDELE